MHVWQLRLFPLRNLIVRKDAVAFDLPALRERQLQAMSGIAERGDCGAEKNRMNVQTDFIDQARGQKRLRQFAAAHQADLLAGSSLQVSHKHNCVARDQFDTGSSIALSVREKT